MPLMIQNLKLSIQKSFWFIFCFVYYFSKLKKLHDLTNLQLYHLKILVSPVQVSSWASLGIWTWDLLMEASQPHLMHAYCEAVQLLVPP